jgi:HSP20 family protein
MNPAFWQCSSLPSFFRISYSKFQQTILLPENVEKDKISAKVEHGILSIEIPKVKEEEKQKTSKAIEVK